MTKYCFECDKYWDTWEGEKTISCTNEDHHWIISSDQPERSKREDSERRCGALNIMET